MANQRFKLMGIIVGTLVMTMGTMSPRVASGQEKGAEVLARIGDRVITRADLEKRIERFGPDRRSFYETPDGRAELLQQIVRIDVFSRRARELGMDEDPAFRARIEAIEKTFLASDYAKRIAESAKVSEGEAKAYYDTHPEEFHVPEQIKAPSIMVGKPADASPAEIAMRRARIEEARHRAVNGAPFSELIERYSDEVFTGTSDFFSRGALVPEIEDTVFSLRIGEVSPVLEVKDAYLVFKLEDRRPPHEKPFEEVRQNIMDQLAEGKKIDALTLEEGKLYKRYGVSFPARESGNRPTGNLVFGTIMGVRPVEPPQKGGAVLGWVRVKTEGHGVGPSVVLVIRDSTRLRREGAPDEGLSFGDLKKGQRVSMELGPVAATAPPRADAIALTVLTAKGARQP